VEPVAAALDAGIAWLSARGLNVSAVLPTEELTSQVPGLSGEAAAFPRLLLLGSTGSALWDQLELEAPAAREHPVDEHCSETIERFCQDFLGDVRHRVLWPADSPSPLPLTELARSAGWSYRSPLGIGIHPRHGLWLAYRGAVLLDCEIPERREPESAHPCESCDDKPCLEACPPGAVGGPAGLDLSACWSERSRPEVPCASVCLARGACPAGQSSRYPELQRQHHHRFAGQTLAVWFASDPDGSLPSPPEWHEGG